MTQTITRQSFLVKVSGLYLLLRFDAVVRQALSADESHGSLANIHMRKWSLRTDHLGFLVANKF